MVTLMLIILACLFVFTGKPVIKHLEKSYSRMAIVILYACSLWVGIATINLVAPTFSKNVGMIDFGLRSYALEPSNVEDDSEENGIMNILNFFNIYKAEVKSDSEVVESIVNPNPIVEEMDTVTNENPLAANTTYEKEVNPDEVQGPPCLGSFVDDAPATPTKSEVKQVAKATNISSKKSYKYNLSEADKVALQKVALAEAKCDGVKGMALVMKVILNRLDSPKFPNSVTAIVAQKNQFSTYYNGNYHKAKLCDESREALELVLTGWDESHGALYFEHNPKGKATWQRKNLTTLFTYKGHTFSK